MYVHLRIKDGPVVSPSSMPRLACDGMAYTQCLWLLCKRSRVWNKRCNASGCGVVLGEHLLHPSWKPYHLYWRHWTMEPICMSSAAMFKNLSRVWPVWLQQASQHLERHAVHLDTINAAVWTPCPMGQKWSAGRSCWSWIVGTP